MSTMWNTPRGEQLFRIYLTGALDDPNAKEFPTPKVQKELLNASNELMELASPEQIGDFITSATDFLGARGMTIYEFSLRAIGQIRGPVPMKSARLSLAASEDTLSFTTAMYTEETMEEYASRITEEQGGWDIAQVDAVIELDDLSNSTNVRIDRFAIKIGSYMSGTLTSYWLDGASAEYDITEEGFWVQDYLLAQNLLASEQRLT
jgi:hypothetical protein